MAITRAQQAKQMLQDGGMLVQPGFGGKRQGYRGDAAAAAGAPGYADPGPQGDPGEGQASPGSGVSEATGGFAPTKGTVKAAMRDVIVPPPKPDIKPNVREPFSPLIFRAINAVRNKLGTPYSLNAFQRQNFLRDALTTEEQEEALRDLAIGAGIGTTNPMGISRNIERGMKSSGFLGTGIGGGQFITDKALGGETAKSILNEFGYDDYLDTPDKERREGTGEVPYWAQLGYNSEAEYLAALQAQRAVTTDQEPESTQEEPEEEQGLFRRFRADGGIMNTDVVGGDFDFESARQMYGLGKLVKKVTKTVKKIAKSPVGKAAILYAAGFGIPGTNFGGLFGSAPGSMFGPRASVFGKFGIKSSLQGLGLAKSVTDAGAAATRVGPLANFGIGSAITAAALLPLLGLGTGEEDEEEAEELIRGKGLDINAIRANPNQFLARRFRAEGGSMKEPVAKKVMPLLDLDGKEMDLRAEGGFVPIGRMEKADDVPARLSKNEFVFTADAVRNAGDGDVDKGAEVMYNMMKNLESGGDVSEESQGLEGARKMFQTSQRLEEVL